jgi:Uma2 family endonuclease
MDNLAKLVTADDLLHMPRGRVRRELVAGELREMPLRGLEDSRIATNFALTLGSFVKQQSLGVALPAGVGFVLARDPDTVRAPCAAFIARDRLASIANRQGFFPGAPDLAVEVISPNDTYSEVEEKVAAWLDAGCLMVVVANPRNRTLKVYRSRTEILVLTIDDTFSGSDLLPGFQLPVKEIFML